MIVILPGRRWREILMQWGYHLLIFPTNNAITHRIIFPHIIVLLTENVLFPLQINLFGRRCALPSSAESRRCNWSHIGIKLGCALIPFVIDPKTHLKLLTEVDFWILRSYFNSTYKIFLGHF